jgi:hypothetical protein
MQNLAKRQWGHSLSIKESADIMIEWCVRAREKNVLRKKPPQIFYGYVLEDMPLLNYFQNVSSVFKYSQKDVPYVDQVRDSLLRCLSVALKAHYFLFQFEKVAHEPYFFSIPNLLDPSQTIVGLLYKIEKEDKVILVCEKQLSGMFYSERDKLKILYEFPAVVIEDSFKWFSMKSWGKYKQEALALDPDGGKPWLNKKLIMDIKYANSKEFLEQIAHPVDVPYEIKEDIKPLGIIWAEKLNTWCLPKGFDVESVNEYIRHVLNKHKK